MVDDSTDCSINDERQGDVDSHQAFYDWRETTPTEAIVSEVARVGDRDPLDLEPLYESVNPATFDALLDASRNNDLRIGFEYEGVHITVEKTGRVTVEPANGT